MLNKARALTEVPLALFVWTCTTPSMKSLVELFKARGFLGQSPEPLVATSGTPKRSASAGESEFCELASKRERTLAGGPLFLLLSLNKKRETPDEGFVRRRARWAIKPSLK